MAFWSLVAQIVPVLALALVVEARGLAGRFIETPPWRKKNSQTAWGWLVLIAMVLLTTTFVQALIASILAPTEPAWTGDPVTRALAIVVTTFGLMLVFSIPLTYFVMGTTSGAWWRFDARFPWGRIRRLVSRIDYALDHQERVRRKLQSLVLDERMRYAEALVSAARSGNEDEFDAAVMCFLHASAPCRSEEEHHAKELAWLNEWIQYRADAIGSLERDRVRLLRFAVTGRSTGQLENSRRKLSDFLGRADATVR